MANEVVKVTEVVNTISASISDGSYNLLAGGTIGGPLQLNSTLTVGVDDTGYDVKFFGDAASKFMHWDASADELKLPDATKLTFGNSDDLWIWHDSSNSFLQDTGTGALYIEGSSINLRKYNSAEYFARFISDGRAELYYNGSKKIETTNTGATITGKLICTGDMDVSGTTTTFNSTVVLVEDPILTLGGTDPAGSDDNKDRGIEFHYHDGSSARVGFFGYDDSASAFTFLTAASNSSEVFSGTAGAINCGAIDVAAGWIEMDTAYGLQWGGTANRIWGSGGNNYIKVETNGVERLRVIGTGEVGIGTTAPASKLHVTGTVQVGVDDTGHDVKFFGATAGAYMLWDESEDEFIITGPNSTFKIFENANDDVRFGTNTADALSLMTNGSRRLTVLSGGNVGIGTTAPSTFLDVNVGSTGAAGINIESSTHQSGRLFFSNDTTIEGIALYNAEGTLQFSTGAEPANTSGDTKMVLTAAGNLGIGATAPATTLHIKSSDPVIRFEDSAPDGIYGSIDGAGGTMIFDADRGNGYAGSNIQFRVDNSEAMRVIAGGKVGINVAAPSTLLEVRGDAGAAGILTLSTAELTVVDGNELGRINFSAPLESSGTDSILVAASIYAEADDTFDASTNDTDLVFATGLSETATEKMRLDSAGKLTVTGAGRIEGHLDLASTSDFSGMLRVYDKIGIGGGGSWVNAASALQIGSRGTQSDPTFADAQGDGIIFDFYNDSSPYQRHAVIAANSADSTEAVLDFWTTAVSGSATKKLTIDGAGLATFSGAITVGVNDTGHDVKFFGATSGKYMLWDESADLLQLADGVQFVLGNSNDLSMVHDGSQTLITNYVGNLTFTQESVDSDIIFKCDDGSGGVETYFLLDGSLSSGDPVTLFPDSSTLAFGDSKDFQLMHNGTNTRLRNYTGNLEITQYADDSDIIFECDDGSGGTETYFYLDGSASSGNPVTVFPDSSRLAFGAAGDLEFSHDGSNSYIKNETGGLSIIQYADNNDITFQCDNGSGGVETYFYLDGSASSGEPFTVFPDNSYLALGTGTDLLVYHDGTDSWINNATGDLYIRNRDNDKDVIFQCDDGSGGVETYFYLDGSASAGNPYTKFPDSSYLVLGDSADLQLIHDGTNSHINNYEGDFYITQHTNDKDLIFRSDDGSGGFETYFFLDGSASAGSPYTTFPDGSHLTFGTGRDLSILHDGNNSYIWHNGTGNFYIDQLTDDADIIFRCDNGSGGETAYLTLDGSSVTIEAAKRLNITTSANSTHFGLTGTASRGLTIATAQGDSQNDAAVVYDACDTESSAASSRHIWHLGGVERMMLYNESGVGTLRLKDDVVFSVGNSRDLRLLHNGTDSVIDNITGDLYITNKADDKDIIFRCDDGSGGYENYFYLDGSASAGAPYTVFPDNSNLTLGSGNDCTLYHNGTNTYISNATGSLVIQNNANDADIVFNCDDGSGSIETYFFLDGSASSGEPNTVFPDGSHLRFGTGLDLDIIHDGSNTYLNNSTGDLYIRSLADDKDLIFQCDDGSGGVETYFFLDGSQSGGDPYTRFPDNSYLVFGDSGDLNIRHDGTNSSINNETGDFYIRNNANDKDIIFQGDDGSGGSETYFFLDGSAGGGSPYTVFPDNSNLTFGTGSDFTIYHNGSNTYLDQVGTGNMYLRQTVDDGIMYFQNDDGSGGLETYFYLDGSASAGNPVTIFPDNSKLSFGDSQDMGLTHNGANSYIENSIGDLYISNHDADKDIIFSSDDGSGGIETYFYLDGSLSSGHPHTVFPDNSLLTFGTGGSDLTIHHDGTDSKIRNQTGDLVLIQNTNDGDIVFQCDDESGGVTEYFRVDGSEGQTIVTKNVKFLDNARAKFGTGSDLSIFHDGSNSYIQEGGTGDLIVNTNAFRLKSANNADSMITAFEDGAVNLMHNDITKFSTTSDGITVTGAMALTEVSTPTATADHGKVYTKSDNKLYFQDGAGTEHEIAFA